jgi:hypothetical protein
VKSFSNAFFHGLAALPYVLVLEKKDVSLGNPTFGNDQPIASRIGNQTIKQNGQADSEAPDGYGVSAMTIFRDKSKD